MLFQAYSVIDTMTNICWFIDSIVAFVFPFVPSYLRMFSVSMLILSIGKIFDAFDNKWLKVLKWCLYIGFMVYSAWSLAVLTNIQDVDLLDFGTIAFGIIAPICMMLVGRRLSQIEIKGHRIFTYYVLWIIYFLLCLLWKFIFPLEINLSFCFMYLGISVFIVWLITKIKGGVN